MKRKRKLDRLLRMAPLLLALSPVVADAQSLLGGVRFTGHWHSFGSIGFGESASSTAPFVSVAAGGDTSAAIRADGTYVIWGSDHNLQSRIPVTTAQYPLNSAFVSQLALGGDSQWMYPWEFYGEWTLTYELPLTHGFGLGVTSPGAPVPGAVGTSTGGNVLQFGFPNYGTGTPPYQTETASNVVAVTAGEYSGYALFNDHTAVGWGQSGQVPSKVLYQSQSSSPFCEQVQGNIASMAAAGEGCLAVLLDGTVAAWGDNSYQECNVPAALQQPYVSNVVMVAGGGCPTVGTVNYGFYNWGPDQPPGAGEWPGPAFGLALTSNGAVYAWGDDSCGQTDVPLSVQPNPLAGGPQAVKIVAGWRHAVALLSDHTVVEWGQVVAPYVGKSMDPMNPNHVLIDPAIQGHVVDVAAGANHTIALLDDGSIVGWGQDESGQCEAPPSASLGTSFISYAISDKTLLAVQPNNHVVGWGVDDQGIISGIPSAIQGKTAAIAIGGVDHQTWEHAPNYEPNFTFSYAPTFAVAVLTNHTLAAWGDDSVGQCDVPGALSDFVAVSAGFDHAMALTSGKRVVAWGGANPALYTVPAAVQGHAIQISAGGHFCAALLDNGTVALWGDDSQGQCDVPSNNNLGTQLTNNFTAIAAGGTSVVALLTNGQTAAWGGGINSLGGGWLSGYRAVGAGSENVVYADPDLPIGDGAGTGDGQMDTGVYNLLNDGSANAFEYLPGPIGIVSSAAGSPLIVPALALSFPSWTGTGGSPVTGTVSLGQPATTGGAVVSISSNNPLVGPTSVTIPAGKRTATFSLPSMAFPTQTTVLVTANLGGTTSQAAYTYAPLNVIALSVSAESVVGGSNTEVTGTVTIPTHAPAGGVTVNLTSSSPNLIVPATVVVPEGTTKVKFPITGGVVGNSETDTITATAGANTLTGTLTLNPMVLIGLTLPKKVEGGTVVTTARIVLNAKPAAPVTIQMSSPNEVTCPASLTIPAGEASFDFPVTGTITGPDDPAAGIVGSFNGSTVSATTYFAAPTFAVFLPAVQFLDTTGSKAVYGNSEYACGPDLGWPLQFGSLQLTMGSAGPISLVQTMATVTAGSPANTAFQFTTADVSTKTSATVSAALPWWTNPVSQSITVAPNLISSVGLDQTTVHGGATVNLTITLDATVLNAVSIQAAASSSAVTIPGTITLPAVQNKVTIPLSTSLVASDKTITITLTRLGVTKSIKLTLTP